MRNIKLYHAIMLFDGVYIVSWYVDRGIWMHDGVNWWNVNMVIFDGEDIVFFYG